MCTPDIPEPPPIPDPPAPQRQNLFDASEIFGRRQRRQDPSARSGFAAASFSTVGGVPTATSSAPSRAGGLTLASAIGTGRNLLGG